MTADVIIIGTGQAGASAQTIVDAEMVHPTFAEGLRLQTLVMRLDRYALS